jgi:hypothetical protein
LIGGQSARVPVGAAFAARSNRRCPYQSLSHRLGDDGMHRLRLTLLIAFLAGIISSCGEDQPNAPAQPGEVTADFAKNAADMMKKANTGMDPKAAKQAKTAPPTK